MKKVISSLAIAAAMTFGFANVSLVLFDALYHLETYY